MDDTIASVELRKDPEIAGLISPLTREERHQLETNLLTDGCRDPLVAWPQPEGPPILLDGHNRFDICTAHELPYQVTLQESLASREEAINWVVANQLGRRNLDPEAKSYLRGKRYNLEKKGKHYGLSAPENQGHPTTADRLASEYQVSWDTIERDGGLAPLLDVWTPEEWLRAQAQLQEQAAQL